MANGRLLEGKTALITAGTSGLGGAFSRAFAAHGAAVGIHYRSDAEGAEALAREIRDAGGRAARAHADLRDPDAARAMATKLREELGGFDILVNNASIYLPPQSAESVPWQDVLDELEGSLKTSLNATQAVLPGMLKRGSGVILFLVGTMLRRPHTGYSAHAAGKGAMLAWARTLAKEIGPRGVSVHFLSPGVALTPGTLDTMSLEEREAVRRKTPTRRLPEPEELARLAVFLASDLASCADALHLNADGGLADLG